MKAGLGVKHVYPVLFISGECHRCLNVRLRIRLRARAHVCWLLFIYCISLFFRRVNETSVTICLLLLYLTWCQGWKPPQASKVILSLESFVRM